MFDNLDIEAVAEEHGIDLDYRRLSHAASLSIEFPDGSCAVVVDPQQMETHAEERTYAMHEIGHCISGAFYSKCAPALFRRKCELRADKRAIEYFIPRDALYALYQEGHYEIWDVAEHFNVTEEFAYKAMWWYANGNMDIA